MSSSDGKGELRFTYEANERLSIEDVIDLFARHRDLGGRYLLGTAALATFARLQRVCALADACVVADGLNLSTAQIVHPAAQFLVATLRIYNRRRHGARRKHRHLGGQLHDHATLEAANGRAADLVPNLERCEAKLVGPVDAQRHHLANGHALRERVPEAFLLDAVGLEEVLQHTLLTLVLG